jgi:acyl carrier protein
MDRNELKRSLSELVEETTGEPRPEIGEDQDLKDGLGLDSVDLFSLVVEIQNKFRVKIASEELVAVVTVGDLLDVLQSKIAAA